MGHLLRFLVSLFTSSLRSRLSLQLEVAALRHQLSVYQFQQPWISPGTPPGNYDKLIVVVG